MSVYNRKMFKPRNARNALSMSAGIMPVQKFHAGGPVGHTHQGNVFQRFMNAPNSLSGVVNALRGNTNTGTTASLQPMIPVGGNRKPPISMTEIEAAAIREASQPQTTGQRITGMLDYDDGVSGAIGRMVGPDSSKLGIRSLQELAKGAGQVVDLAATGTAAAIAPFASSNNMGAGTKAGPAVPTPGVIDSLNKGNPSGDLLGVDIMTLPGVEIGTKPPPLPAGTAPGISVNIGAPGARTRPRPETPAQMMERIATADAAMKTDMSPAEVQRLEDQNRMQQGQVPNEPDDLVETSPFDDKDDTETEGSVESTSKADPTDPGPKDPEDPADRDEANNQTAAIVAQAKAANAKAGVPSLTTAKQEVDVASQKGTGSPEDIKADFLKLLPKYEDDPKVNGLNIALMGFAIAKDGLVEGMKKTLPNFIKSAEKRQAFKRETDLLASKYAIQRKEGDRTRGLTEKDYFVATAFTSPDGRKFVPGQPVTLSRDAFKLMESQGLTGNLTTSSIYLEQAKAKTKAAQGLGYKEINALYKNETREFGGIKYDILVPTPYGLKNGATSTVLASENDLPVLTNAYVSNLDKINALDLGVQEARALVATGDATGGKAVIGNLFDGLRGAGMNGILKSVGFSPPEKLSIAGQYAKVHGVLAMQLAPILLGESGRTISDVDRVRVATALGYEASIDKNGNAVVNLAGGPGTLFQSKEQADAALVEVQNILRNRAKEEHAKYRGVMTSVGQVFEERKVDENTQSALTQGLGGSLVMGEDNIYDIVPAG